MKTITKLALATVAVSSIVSANVLADDVRTVERYNNHGVGTIVYRQCDHAPSVAVYAQGQSVGNTVARDSGSYPRFTLKDNAHGGSHFLYRAE